MTQDDDDRPSYLEPYLDAARVHGGRFGSLLWASPQSQAARFHAIMRIYDFRGKSLLDAGCGWADLLDFLLNCSIRPDHYVGLEAVDATAAAAERKRHPRCTIVRGDFVREPVRLFVGADAVVFCGSLNTLAPADFRRTVRTAFDAATEALIFNFLCSPRLAAAEHLTWYAPETILALASELSDDHLLLDDYLEGDATILIRRKDEHAP